MMCLRPVPVHKQPSPAQRKGQNQLAHKLLNS